MKAEKMFGELGFKKLIEKDRIVFYDGITIVLFDLSSKDYTTIKFYKGDCMEEHCISLKLHHAINQQLKELGWI